MEQVTLAAVQAAAAAIGGAVSETPCLYSRTLSELTGGRVFLKFENLQFTASFKERGALNKLLSLSPAERERGVIAMSAGNHAQAVAYHASRLGIHAVIVMPRSTPATKLEHTRRFGAEVVLEGADVAEAAVLARKLGAERDLQFVHPYDDPAIIAGQGTVALEMLEAQPDLEVLLVPIGGGGLISGIAVAATALRPGIRVVGVEAARYPSMRQALSGLPITCGTSTLADGLAVKEPGLLTREIVRKYVDEILLVDEDSIEDAVLLLLDVEKTVTEGAGAVGLAALLEHRTGFAGRRVGVVLSGGNIDLFPLSSILQRGLVRMGRLARVYVALEDRPGQLAKASQALADLDASIVEAWHQRRFTQLPLEAVEVEFVIRTRGREHLDTVLAELGRRGFTARLGPSD